jgi:hypothetical protein
MKALATHSDYTRRSTSHAEPSKALAKKGVTVVGRV